MLTIDKAPKHICQACPVAGACLTRGSPSRSLAISPMTLSCAVIGLGWPQTRLAGPSRRENNWWTCLRNHQGAAGVAEVPVAWSGQRRCRMDPAGHRLQPEDSVARMAYPPAG